MKITGSSKKQKVLHTRVSADLEKDLKSRAAQLGMSVSNLVRNVLLNTVDLVETVVVDTAKLAGSAKGLAQPGTSSKNREQHVVGWQEVTLNLNAICSQCNTILPKGEKATIAIPATRPPLARCLQCLPKPAPEV